MIKRIILLIILAFEGITGSVGGILLVKAPDGSFLKMSVEVMHGAFPNFFIPGLILTGLGLLTVSAFIIVLCKNQIDCFIVGLSLFGFVIWFTVEIIILRQIYWLHFVSGIPVLIGFWAAFPLVNKIKK